MATVDPLRSGALDAGEYGAGGAREALGIEGGLEAAHHAGAVVGLGAAGLGFQIERAKITVAIQPQRRGRRHFASDPGHPGTHVGKAHRGKGCRAKPLEFNDFHPVQRFIQNSSPGIAQMVSPLYTLIQ